jgi:hypothetical protein
MNDLGVLDAEAELFPLTLLEVCDVRALQLQSDLERIDCKSVCKILLSSVSALSIIA